MRTFNEIMDIIINQAFKNGKLKLADDKREMLIQFRDFNIEEDWMEGKTLTKVEKMVESAIKNKDLLDLSCRGLYGLRDYSKERLGNYKNTFAYKHGDENEKARIKDVAERAVEIFPILEKIQYMRDNRTMTNGKLPKAARIEQERKAIKGSMNPILKVELERITESFRLKMLDWWKDYLRQRRERAVEFFAKPKPEEPKSYKDREAQMEYSRWRKAASFHDMVMNPSKEGSNGRAPKSDEELDQMAYSTSKSESQNWFFKMADKLGGMVTADNLESVNEILDNQSSPFESRLRFDFKDGAGFTIVNKVVVNTSPLGNPFYQYPCTFHDATAPGGEKIKSPDEYSVKHAFNQAIKA